MIDRLLDDISIYERKSFSTGIIGLGEIVNIISMWAEDSRFTFFILVPMWARGSESRFFILVPIGAKGSPFRFFKLVLMGADGCCLRPS